MITHHDSSGPFLAAISEEDSIVFGWPHGAKHFRAFIVFGSKGVALSASNPRELQRFEHLDGLCRSAGVIWAARHCEWFPPEHKAALAAAQVSQQGVH